MTYAYEEMVTSKNSQYEVIFHVHNRDQVVLS